MENNTIIRASSLPSYADCARRSAAKLFGREISSGLPLREIKPSVGAAIGTAVHSYAAAILMAKKYNLPQEAAIEKAIETFKDQIKKGCEYDDTTPHIDAAIKQIQRIARAYENGLLNNIEPEAIELQLEANAGDGFLLRGHIDVLGKIKETSAFSLRDLKTGYLARPYQAQLGCYSLLCKSNEQYKNIGEVGVDYIPRGPYTKPQVAPIYEPYNVEVCEASAYALILQIKKDYKNFKTTGSEWSFNANPMSLMCSPKYCPAHGTKFCKMGRPAKKWDFKAD